MRNPNRTLPTNGAAWRKLRARVLAEQPLCCVCNEPATDVDHLDNDPSNNRRDNLASMCHAHHSEKTATEQAGKLWRIRGHDVHGNPLDPNHPWNREEKSLEADSPRHARPGLLLRNGRP